jgi:redox-sensitive bicupin YhaK (pirin superfamily)
MGNKGTITTGDVQWMTAGRGIIHQEMPHGNQKGQMHGFQLWANLPSSLKMMSPRYQDIKSGEIPEVVDDDGTRVRVVCGSYGQASGPVDQVAAEPQYLDVWVPPEKRKSLPVETTRHAFAYVFAGSGRFANSSGPRPIATETVGEDGSTQGGLVAGMAEDRCLVLFDSGDEVAVQSGPAGIRFLLVSGRPLGEPVAWYGPIVMNTQDELRKAFSQLRDGSFLEQK